MKVVITKVFNGSSLANVAIQCPHCGHNGVFLSVNGSDVLASDDGRAIQYMLGIRKCPNERCKGHLFFIFNALSQKVSVTFPVTNFHFDKSDLPTNVLEAMDEASQCFSNKCFVAAAIMIRKTLEEICHDKSAKGKNLKDKISDLGSKIVIPKELLVGMDDLRLLGNDAAHIEAQTYNDIGEPEIEVSLEFTKEILKAVYQYDSLLKKLKGLKVAAVPQAATASPSKSITPKTI